MAEFVNCPQCGSANVARVKYTIWGGLIGPRLLNHVKCQDCRATFNGKTGKSNGGAIALFLIALFVIAFLLAFLFRMLQH